MNSVNNPTYLATETLGRLMRRYAVPCVISLLVGALYNIVDQIFIANAADLGSCGNAANTVVFPLTVIALAIAVMIGDGCCAFASLSLGKEKPRDAAGGVGNAIVLAVLSGLDFCEFTPLMPHKSCRLFRCRTCKVCRFLLSEVIIIFPRGGTGLFLCF